jgi:hypothetical protein
MRMALTKLVLPAVLLCALGTPHATSIKVYSPEYRATLLRTHCHLCDYVIVATTDSFSLTARDKSAMTRIHVSVDEYLKGSRRTADTLSFVRLDKPRGTRSVFYPVHPVAIDLGERYLLLLAECGDGNYWENDGFLTSHVTDSTADIVNPRGVVSWPSLRDSLAAFIDETKTQSLFERSRLIVRGKVAQLSGVVTVPPEGRHGIIQVLVTEIHKGRSEDGISEGCSIRIEIEPPEEILGNGDLPFFRQDEDVVVFLDRGERGAYIVNTGIYSKWRVDDQEAMIEHFGPSRCNAFGGDTLVLDARRLGKLLASPH